MCTISSPSAIPSIITFHRRSAIVPMSNITNETPYALNTNSFHLELYYVPIHSNLEIKSLVDLRFTLITPSNNHTVPSSTIQSFSKEKQNPQRQQQNYSKSSTIFSLFTTFRKSSVLGSHHLTHCNSSKTKLYSSNI